MKRLFILISIIFLTLNAITAQSGQYFASAELAETDCAEGIVYIDIKIKAMDASSTFRLADQNYRISYNELALKPNSAFIEEEGEVSNLAESLGGISVFETHNLNGSQGTIISYNIELAGGAGYLVTADEWVSIGRLGIEIEDETACFDFQFHDTATFPPTYIGEDIGGLLYPVEEGSYHNITACLTDYCESEPPVIQVHPFKQRYSTFIYPTTTEGNLTFEYTSKATADMLDIIISNIAGQPVQRHQVAAYNSDKLQFDVSDLSEGIYIFSTMIEGQQVTKKFIKI